MGQLLSNFRGYDVQATRREAYREGERDGEIKKTLRLIKKKAEKRVAAEETAEMLEEDLTFVKKIYGLLESHPDWNEEKVWEVLQEEKLQEVEE